MNPFIIDIEAQVVNDLEVEVEFDQNNEIDAVIESGGGIGTTDYEKLTHKPSLNGIELIGDVVFGYNELSEKPRPLTNLEIQEMIEKIGGF